LNDDLGRASQVPKGTKEQWNFHGVGFRNGGAERPRV